MNEIARLDQEMPTSDDVTLPHNIEAEQQLLGALLTDNDLYDRAASIVRSEHFYDPIHARIWDICAARIQKNALASPVTLKPFLEEDEGLKVLGGPTYLVTLAASAIAAYAVKDYAQMIYDLAI
ncbi:MAG: DnaB-like helicase N-terminal domain-containing protein, partial [Pseudomonadota bacterium]